MFDRRDAQQLDADDPLGRWRDEFVIPDPDLIYLDGNSLGRTPRRTVTAVRRVLEEQWAGDLISSWWDHGWLDLTLAVGDELAPLIGARPGEVAVHESTTVGLFQLINVALDLNGGEVGGPRRPVIAVDDRDFPTDRYAAESVARLRGGEVRHGIVDLDGVDVVIRSMVDYRTAEIAEVAAETARAAAVGCYDDLGPVARGRCARHRSARPRRRLRGRLHLQVPQRRSGRAGVRVRGRPPARPDRPADLGMVRPVRPVRHGSTVRGAAGDRPDAQRHATGARTDRRPRGDPPDRRGRHRSDRGEGPSAHRFRARPRRCPRSRHRHAPRPGEAGRARRASAIPTLGVCMPGSSTGRSSSTTATLTCSASGSRR